MSQATVETYFETFNAGQFQATAALFAPQGILVPPFETPVVGPAAIATYLAQEAEGMQIEPLQFRTEALPNGQIAIEVIGQVQALVFQVKVAWNFCLNAQGQIEAVRVNLLASLEQLLHLRS